MKSKNIIVRITEEQDEILLERTQKAGFLQRSDYIRYLLFMRKTVDEKLDKIYNWVLKNDR